MSASSRRYLSIWLPYLSTERIERCAPREAAKAALATIVQAGNAVRLGAVNPEAARLGLTPGMSLADARALHPGLETVPEHEAGERRSLETIADWCERYTPLVSLALPNGLLLDIAGAAHLFGGEAALRDDVVRRLALQGFSAEAAVADTPGAAWGLSRFGGGGVHRGQEALRSLPLAALKVEPDSLEGLRRAGFLRIGEIADLARAPLAARFGANLLRRLDQALGGEDEALAYRRVPPRLSAERAFAEPIVSEEAVLATAGILAGDLGRRLEAREEGLRGLELVLFRVDGAVARLAIGTSRPTRDPDLVRRLLAERLESLRLDAGYGFDLVRLAVLATDRLSPDQLGLGQAPEEDHLALLIDRLSARLGARRVLRLDVRDSHVPERAVVARPAQAARFGQGIRAGQAGRTGQSARAGQAKWPAGRVASESVARREDRGDGEETAIPNGLPPGERAAEDSRRRRRLPRAAHVPSWHAAEFGQDTASPIRPISLFARPEPIEAMAEVPDGPPVAFRWRRILHRVACAEGPERIAMDWWEAGGPGPTRDYFRVETLEGRRFWLYREGLYERETGIPRWFLHGLFA